MSQAQSRGSNFFCFFFTNSTAFTNRVFVLTPARFVSKFFPAAILVALVGVVMLGQPAADAGNFGTAVNPPSGAASGPPGDWNNGPMNWGQAGASINDIFTFAEFRDAVYAGGRVVSSAPAPTARILKSVDGGLTWSNVTVGFNPADIGVRRLWAGSDGYLYAVTGSQGTAAPRIYRSGDGTQWAFVAALDPTDNYGRWFVEFNGYLYLATIADSGTGARIYRSADGTSWEVAFQFRLPITRVQSLFVGNGNIYATTNQAGPGGSGFIFGSADGVNFTKLNQNQMIGEKGSLAHSLIFYKGAYYVGQQSVAAGRIWRSTDLASWSIVFQALGGTQEPELYRLYSTGDLLWAGTRTLAGVGGRVYSSPDGVTWTQSGAEGFGDVNYHGVRDFIFLSQFDRLLTSQYDLSGSTDYPTRPQFVNFGSTMADLKIAVTDGKTAVVAGAQDTYTITVTNSGGASMSGVKIRDSFPAFIIGVTFTATESGGASGFTASGSGNIADAVTLPAGSSITYKAIGKISSSASGTLANTAAVTAPAGVSESDLSNNSATDTDTITRKADLKVTVSDGKTSAIAGQNDTYTITVTNLGPSDVNGATISDSFPRELTGVKFTATQTGGASGFTASGKGDIHDTVSMSAAAKITYKAQGRISPLATGSISNTASVHAPSGVIDPILANNSATDTDTPLAQRIGFLERIGRGVGSGHCVGRLRQ